MKILQVIPSLEMGGAETMCEGLSRMLYQQGQQVTLVSLYRCESPITKRLAASNVKLVFLDKKPGLDIKCIGALRRCIRQEKPDVIHVHLYALKYVAAALLGKSIPVVHTIHNVAAYDAEGDTAVNRFLYRSNRAVPVSLTREIQKTVMEHYGLEEEQTPVIYNGIDLSNCMPKSDYSLSVPADIIHIGRFWEQKNHMCIVDAAKILADEGRDFRIHFYGDGSEKETVRTHAQNLGVLDKLCFEGITDWVFPHLNSADLFILPSKWEGMPMTIIEAMGTGLPVIASDVGGVGDMISNDHNGLLIRPDARELAQAIGRLLDDAELRQALGENARIESLRFSGETMARHYLELYRSLQK